MKKIILIFLLFIFGFNLISAGSQLVDVNYNSSVSSSVDRGPYDFSNVLLKVNTLEGEICKFSTSPGNSYLSMSGNFDYIIGTSSYKNILGLFDGNTKYYIKCKKSDTLLEPGELEVVLKINSLVTGKILLSEDSPLHSGKVEVNLITSKVVSQAPILTYSVDGTKYEPVILVGAEKNWKGYVILESNLGEGVLSFNLRAVDLEGRVGTEILVGSAFPYDTVRPTLITNIEAISDVGEIKLKWHAPENVNKFNIYRSTTSNPDYTDFYKSTEKNYFYDTDVDKGKNYYYKVSSVDSSGNEADLSKEVSGVSLENDDDLETGLSPQLRGKVESFILEIDSLIEELDSISASVSDFSSKESDLYTRLKLGDKLKSVKGELTALKTSVEKLKTQDLSSEELNQKIDSSRVRLNVLEKEIPSGLNILEEDSRIEETSEEFILKSLTELDNFLSEKEKERSIKATLDLINENSIKIQSTFYSIEVEYLDGSTKDFFIVNRNINSEIERLENAYFIDILTDNIVEKGKIQIKNIDGEFLSDNFISFGSDSKEISYYIEGISNSDDLRDISSGFVYISKEEINPGLTGFSIFNSESGKYSWIVGIVFLLMIIIYFVYAKMNNYSDNFFRISNKISEGLRLIKRNKLDESKKVYFEVKNLYSSLKVDEKEKIYDKVEGFFREISLIEFGIALEELKKTKDKNLLNKLEKIYDGLPISHKEKISTLFNRIKGELENEK